MSPTVLNKKCMYLLKGLRLLMKPYQCFSIITVFSVMVQQLRDPHSQYGMNWAEKTTVLLFKVFSVLLWNVLLNDLLAALGKVSVLHRSWWVFNCGYLSWKGHSKDSTSTLTKMTGQVVPVNCSSPADLERLCNADEPEEIHSNTSSTKVADEKMGCGCGLVCQHYKGCSILYFCFCSQSDTGLICCVF